MEALVALTFAGNVAQFIEYSIKAILGTSELFDSANGTVTEIVELKSIVDSVKQSLMNIEGSKDTINNGAVLDTALVNLNASCLAMSGKIVTILDGLKLEDGAVRFDRVMQKARIMAKKPELDELCRRLYNLRDQISAHLLVLIREQQQNLAQNLRRLASSSEEVQKTMENKLNKVIDCLRLNSEQTNHSQETPAQASGRRASKLWKRDAPKDIKSEQTLWDANGSPRPEFVQIKNYVTEMELLFEQKRKTILDTLHFSQVKEREFAVAEAHRNTLQWIFNEKGKNNFVAWLRQSDDIYWISGKAGSGKSTLMRFLTDYPNTTEFLKEWAGKKDLIVAKHYFWNPGTAIQKSQEGLFRSLLLQILYQRPQLIPAVCADRWNAQYGDTFHPWSRTELMETFARLDNLKMLGCRICLFIDGLDEYDGDHAQLVSLIRHIGASQDIKICASSRQWLDFSDAFEQSEWKLYLHDLTHDDIRKFIQDNLNEDTRFNRLQQRNKAAAEGLGLEITERAHGVFL
ncbi:hypothetical protein EDB80DRAFT_880472 [Ilyonectria destructans]|nr:hypothetical protein EDB80DRAFT_880472 [Ilyonectria destructans]